MSTSVRARTLSRYLLVPAAGCLVLSCAGSPAGETPGTPASQLEGPQLEGQQPGVSPGKAEPELEAPTITQPETPGEAPGETPEAKEEELSGDTLELHEWGTFTSVQSADGVDMEGLHHEEEPLPGFVHGRDSLCFGGSKCMEFVPGGVTQKMETPVIYFHGRHAGPITVKVDFPQGVISQWYPEATAYAPATGSLVTSKPLAGGSMTWTVDLDPKGWAPPAIVPGDIWEPSRDVASRPLRGASGEDEGFIFYRGLGSFSLPLRTRSDALGRLTVSNEGDEAIPAAFLVQVVADDTGSRGAVLPLGAIAARGHVTTGESLELSNFDTFLARAKDRIRASLVQSGLRGDEATAMVETWAISYFHTPGLRVLYVLPRAWTDALLPLHVDVPLDRVVRTLVGRVEVTTHAQTMALRAEAEAALLQGCGSWEASTCMPSLPLLGRHTEAKLRAAADGLPPGRLAAWLLEVAAMFSTSG